MWYILKGKWLTIVDEQYAECVDDMDIVFTYMLDGDNLEMIRENGNAMPYIISFDGDNLITMIPSIIRITDNNSKSLISVSSFLRFPRKAFYVNRGLQFLC